MYYNKSFIEEFQNAIIHDFKSVMDINAEPYKKLMTYYQCAIYEIETKFKVLNEEFSLTHDRNPIENVKTRLKSMDSIVEKMQRKGIQITADNIEKELSDVAGVRVICTFIEDIYNLADCLTEQDDITLIEKKDYIKNPKESGYRSLHLIVEVPIFLHNEKRSMKVEVQLRTISMNFWASLEHQLRYKKDLPEQEKDYIAAELKICAEENAVLDYRMQEIRKKLEGFEVDDTTDSKLLKLFGIPQNNKIVFPKF